MSSETTSEIFPKNVEKKEIKLRARRIMLTIHEVDKYEQIKKNLMGRKTFRYLIAGKETCPETGKEHIHMYVEFNQQTVVTKALTMNQRIDVVKSKNQAIDYCTKDCCVIDQIGEESHQGSKTVKELIECKDPTSLDPKLFKTWQAVKAWDQSHTMDEWYCPNKEVFWIWGDSGVGKTKKAAEMVGVNRCDRVKCSNSFWNGVSMNEAVRWCIYDDFRDSHMHPSELISFCDYYRNQMNVKGSCVLNHYDHIIITSVQSPYDIYPNMKDDEPKQQWLRRIKIIHVEMLPGLSN